MWHYPGGNEESNENPVSIAGHRAEILNRDLPMKKKNLNLMPLLPIFLVPNHQPTPLPETEMAPLPSVQRQQATITALVTCGSRPTHMNSYDRNVFAAAMFKV